MVLGVAVLLMGNSFVHCFRPPDYLLTDFIQEWLSGRNYFVNEPVYQNQHVTLLRHMPEFRTDISTFLPWNAHPPAAVLIALPLARFDYQTAQFIWNLVTFTLFVFSIWLVWRELATRFQPWHVFSICTLLLFASPVVITLRQGQLNFLLAFLLTVGWVADRHGYQLGAGLAVGLAAGLKLFPGFILLYFLGAGRWRAAIGLVIGAVVINALTLAVVGIGAFETYVREVIPSLQVFQSGWRNISINGWVLRLLDPHPIQAGPEAYRNPVLAKLLTAVGVLLVSAVVVWIAIRARRTVDPDRGWAVALTGMLLVSPITWSHYLVLLVVPLAVLANRIPPGPTRWCGWVVVAVLCVPDLVFGLIALGLSRRQQLMGAVHHVAMTPAQNLFGISALTYAVIALFVLTLLIPERQAVEPRGGGN